MLTGIDGGVGARVAGEKRGSLILGTMVVIATGMNAKSGVGCWSVAAGVR